MTSSAPEPLLLIDGTRRHASGGATFPVINPATGMEIGRAPDATDEDAEEALAA